MERVKRLQERLRQEAVDAFMVACPENRRYLSGFTGTAGVLVISEDAHLLVDFRYFEQARQECPGWQIHEIKDSMNDLLAELLPRWGVSVLGCEGDFLTYQQVGALEGRLEGIKVVPLYNVVGELRQVKEPDEVKILNKAAELADLAFENILGFLRPGKTEQEVALELEYFMRRRGSRKASFEFIVASGVRGAMPHGVASDKVLQKGELVILDYGCEYQGYYSDITRTVVIGGPAPRQEEIYNIVLEAQRAGLARIKAGVKASDVHRAVQEVIEGYGYGENFGHGTGHGVGLAVHEEPRLSKKSESTLRAGMVVTVEPGIYLPGWGGIRIEDMVLVEETGCQVLTTSPKDSLIVCAL